MLDFDELQEFPKNSSWATKSDFISDLMGTQNHQKTLYESWLQGCHTGKWTIVRLSEPVIILFSNSNSFYMDMLCIF